MNLGSLLALFGAQGAGQTPGATPGIAPPPNLDTQGEDIIQVNGNRRKQEPLEFPDPLYDINPEQANPTIEIDQAGGDRTPFPQTNASPQQQARQNPLKGLVEHKGMFGTKGTLRDVLGILGDALLVGDGGQAMYQPKRLQENSSDALVGYGQGDENADNAALARLAQVNPKMYNDFLQQHENRQVKRDVAKSQAEAKTNAQRIQKAKMMPGLLANAKTPESQAALRKWYEDPASSIEDLDNDTLASAAISEYQKATLGQGKEKIEETVRSHKANEGISMHRAQSARISATKPRAGSRAPNPTDASMAAPILAKVRDGKTLTEGERQFLKRTGYSEDRGSARGGARARLQGAGGGSGGKLIRQGNNLFDPVTKKFVRTVK